jgi:hypothetical protein
MPHASHEDCRQEHAGHKKQSPGAVREMIEENWRRWGWLFPVVGFFALLWFLIRVVPRPSRVRYPCQQVAGPLAFSFLAWLGGMVASVFAARRMRKLVRNSRYVLAGVCAVAVLGGAWFAIGAVDQTVVRADEVPEEKMGFTPTDAPNEPMGEGVGIHPGRVVWDYDPDTTSWDGNLKTGHWWAEENIDQEAVSAMLARSVKALAGEDSVEAAWEGLFRHFNAKNGRGERGFKRGEKIAVKINLNTSGSHKWGNGSANSPQMILALLRQLTGEVGARPADITVLDASRVIGDPIWKLCHGEFPQVRFVDRTGEKGRIKARPDRSVALHHADPSVEGSGKTYFPASIVQADYMINLALLKGHSLAGVTLGAKNHFGSVWREADTDKWNDGWSPGNMHETISVHEWRDGKVPARKMGTYNPLVELMGHQHLDGKTVLFLIEGLYGAPHQGAKPKKWESAPFNGDWTSSLFVSQDPVAIESVALDFLRSEPTLRHKVRGNVDNYLHEAARAADPVSGVQYDPEGDGTTLPSLGAHEHWDNAKSKTYSRNMGRQQGIELVRSGPGATTARR